MGSENEQLRRGVLVHETGIVIARPQMSRHALGEEIGTRRIESLSKHAEFDSVRVFGLRWREEWFAIAWSFHRDVLYECYLGILIADPGPSRADVGVKPDEYHKQWMRDHIGATRKHFDGGAVVWDDYDVKRGSQGIYFRYWMPKVAPWWHRLRCRICLAH